ncbi:PREDICTED: zinc finger BED domain-containing protein RICESLEEPER 2-like [Ipomoea nil]|uniref:zinc finger BED domain-containing protein RICESLEEPER 2-like n=1 Tax=Ipomoea nil TaxID=35883 RepID=UPI000900E6E0|nr:PREDICTED: zinc finger BED domain-containing protein RICESLEEPER 2-like [Ipomoea nil]
MENIIESGSQPSKSSIDGSTVVEGQTVITNNQQNVQPTTAVPEKKRKIVESRSPVWDHYEKIKDSTGVTIKGKCIYCAKIYQCQSKKHGTTSLRNHMLSCLKNPHSKDTRQSLLTFQAITNSDASPATVGFRKFIMVACPRFKIPSRWTISRDINLIYEEERLKLKCVFRGNTQRVSITTDTWTSIQRINYMVVTAHFIDEEWKLNKKIISFVPIISHKGEAVAKVLETCLLDWGIRNVYSITVDNASSNDTAIGFLKKKLMSWGTSIVKGKYIHMRCIAHILNLVVQDGLKQCDSSVKRVREAVRYVRSSPARLKKFRDLAEWNGIERKSSLCLDVPTRWNSTYLMLQSTIIYEKVFESLEESDTAYKSDLSDVVPTFLDWESVKSLVEILKCFYDMTIRISGSLYVTSNTFFSEISDLYCLLNGMVEAGGSVKLMGENMKAKFEKYWGDIDKMNLMIFFANILDPRDKLEYMATQMNHMYGEEKGKPYYEKVIAALKELFNDYAASTPVSTPASTPVSTPASTPVSTPTDFSQSTVGRPQHLLKSQIKKQ